MRLTFPGPRTPRRLAGLLLAVAAASALANPARAQATKAKAPAPTPPDTRPLARYIPRDNLVVYIETERDDIGIELALQYNDSYTESVFSFVNNINTHEGGTHLTGLKSALTTVINKYIEKSGALSKKDRDIRLSGDDVREGIVAVLSVKVREPQFEGQTKTKLGNSEAESAVKSVVNEYLSAYLEEHPRSANTIVEINALNAELALIRRQGYALDDEEFLSGLFCIAVPVVDKTRRECVAALALQAPVVRLSRNNATERLATLSAAAEALSAILT